MFDQGLLTGLASFFSWLAMSILKFIITPSLMTAAGYETWEILLVTFSGAVVGVMLFYHTGKAIFSWWSTFKSKSNFFSNKKRNFDRFFHKYFLFSTPHRSQNILVGALEIDRSVHHIHR